MSDRKANSNRGGRPRWRLTSLLAWRVRFKAWLHVSLTALALGLAACGGVPWDGNSVGRDRATEGSAPGVLAPADFEHAISKPGTVLINVHVPYQGEIPGTDKFIPFDQVERPGACFLRRIRASPFTAARAQ